jgi:hypothetical protein
MQFKTHQRLASFESPKRGPPNTKICLLFVCNQEKRELLFWVKATEFKRGEAESANWFHHT